jgi:hypothetical protein
MLLCLAISALEHSVGTKRDELGVSCTYWRHFVLLVTSTMQLQAEVENETEQYTAQYQQHEHIDALRAVKAVLYLPSPGSGGDYGGGGNSPG